MFTRREILALNHQGSAESFSVGAKSIKLITITFSKPYKTLPTFVYSIKHSADYPDMLSKIIALTATYAEVAVKNTDTAAHTGYLYWIAMKRTQ